MAIGANEGKDPPEGMRPPDRLPNAPPRPQKYNEIEKISTNIIRKLFWCSVCLKEGVFTADHELGEFDRNFKNG